DGLRSVGALSAASEVIAVHLSHHNPPAPELSEILAPMGVRIVEDLDVIDVPSEPPRHRHLVLGGARSGKSHYAESLAARHPDVTYIATAAPQPDDPEWAERIRLHRERRPAHWRTRQTADLVTALAELEPGEAALVDCIGMWLTNLLDEAGAWSDDPDGPARAQAAVMDAVASLAASLDACRGSVIMVTNEVGMDVVPATSSGRLFRDLLGTVNSTLAAHCCEVTLMVAGRPLSLPPVAPLPQTAHPRSPSAPTSAG
ncbi:MAG: bifunctional adenosylcobinamide kinase/adenosylcobinamide-phosphate guanylyltransferase, partial [Actinomycetales bacterium]